jgi:hypothetical protein
LAVAADAVSDEDTSREVFRDLDALVVDLTVGTVELVASRDSTTTVTTSRRWVHRAPSSELRRDGDRLSVSADCSERLTFVGRCDVAYRIAVPPRVRVQVTARTGTVTGTDLETERLAVRATAGDVRLSFATPPQSVSARTLAGNLSVAVPDAPYRVEAHASVGDTHVDVPDDRGAVRVIHATAGTGDVTVRAR